MKEIKLKNDRTVKTPWLRIEEAAKYCGLSRAAFIEHAKNLPHGGDSRTRIYNIKVLDAWIANELDIPFSPEKANKKEIPRRKKTDSEGEDVLVHPNNGEIYKDDD
jgi:hypothetical protein